MNRARDVLLLQGNAIGSIDHGTCLNYEDWEEYGYTEELDASYIRINALYKVFYWVLIIKAIDILITCIGALTFTPGEMSRTKCSPKVYKE